MALTKVTSGLISADASSVDLNIDAGTLYIDATNNRVGIGTSSPSAELSVSNNGVEGYEISPATVIGGTIRQLAFNRSTSAYIPMRIQASEHQFYISGSEKVRIDSSGNVGIGTASPTEKLEVIGDIQTYQLKTLKNYVFGADNYHIKLGEGDGDGYIGNVNAATYISSAGYYYGASQYQLTGGSTGGGVMYLQADGTIRFLNQATTTADSLITPSERMRIDSTGNVRIGATTGFHKVCIAHDDSFTDIASGYTNLELSNPNGTNGTYSRIVFNDAAGGPGSGILGVKFTDTTNNYGQFEFWTRSSSGGSTKMVIDPNGNVGIGTTSPSAKLELNGGDAYFYNTASTGGIRIGYDASNYWDVKRENASIGNLRFYSNGTERVSFLPGGGITFNGDTAAANALDDYEEGTWTPSLTNATGTFTSGGATYTKVGRIVTVNFRLNPSGTAGVVANSTYINNLPISINATSITPVGAFTDVSSSTAGIMGMHGAVSTRIYFTTSYSTGGYISGTLTYESA